MKKVKRKMLMVVVVMSGFVLVSCSNEKGVSQESEIGSGVVRSAIALSYEGRADDALTVLLGTTDPESLAVVPLRCLELNETEFVKLQGAELEQAMEENLNAGRAARSLARAAIAAALEARDNGQEQKGAEWLLRVGQMGKELASDRYNAATQMQGAAIVRDVGKAL